MSVTVTPHPTPGQLEQFSLGRLSADEAGPIEAHLHTCPDCVAALARLAPGADGFLAKLQSVYTDSGRAADTSVIRPAGEPAGPAAPAPAPTTKDAYQTVYTSDGSQLIDAGVAFRAAQGPTEIMTGQTFGDYELLEFIARGGMGVVYKARQRSLNRIVALKMVRADMLDTDKAIQRFYQEARSAASLDHPNIVPIYEIAQAHGHHYFTMAFIPGTRLSATVKPGQPLPARAATELLLPMIDAVGFAHARGIIHRDLKPDNILIDGAGRPRITDFGLAKCLALEAGLTAHGMILGTPEYMAPEQALGDEAQTGPAPTSTPLAASSTSC